MNNLLLLCYNLYGDKMKDEIRITPEELEKLNEDDLILITVPGRMGDVDGISFAIKNNNKVTIYRIDDLVAFKGNIYKQFPKWNEALKNYYDKKTSDKYEVIYMGMGNLLGVDKSIHREIRKIMEEKAKEEESTLSPELHLGSVYYNNWRSVIKEMFNK